MATKTLYTGNGTAMEVPPAYKGSWGGTYGAASGIQPLVENPADGGSSNANGVNLTPGTAAANSHIARWISPAFAAAGSVSGTVAFTLRAYKDAAMTINEKVHITLLDQMGNVRTTLLTNSVGGSITQDSTGYYTVRAAVAITSATAQIGDRILIEAGANKSADSSPNAIVYIGRGGTTAASTSSTTPDGLLGSFTFSNLPANAFTQPDITGYTATVEDFEDTTYNWTMTGSWARSSTYAKNGTWSFKSPTTANSASSDMTLTVPAGATRMQFWHRASSEATFDFLKVLVAGNVVMAASGVPAGWTQSDVFAVTAGQTITFRYQKDSATTAGNDAVYIDDLTFYVPVSVITGSDSGTLTEGATVLVRSTDTTDSGSLTEGTPQIKVAKTESYTLTESASGLTSSSGTTESGSLSEASALTIVTSVTASDTGALSDSSNLSIDVAVPGTDSAAMTDSSVLLVQLSSDDSMSMISPESASLAVLTALDLTDAASLTEISLVTRATSVQDTASLADGAALTGLFQAGDTGQLAESTTSSSTTSVVESATVTEYPADVLRTSSTVDTGTASETTDVSRGTSVVDDAALTETLALTRSSAETDAGTLSEAAQIVSAASTADDGALVDSALVDGSGTLSRFDTAALDDGATINVAGTTTDAASMGELVDVSRGTSTTDSATLSETAQLVISTTVVASDTGALTESSNRSALDTLDTLSAADTAALTDAPAHVSRGTSAGDGASLMDTATVTVVTVSSDSAALHDDALLALTLLLTASDSAALVGEAGVLPRVHGRIASGTPSTSHRPTGSAVRVEDRPRAGNVAVKVSLTSAPWLDDHPVAAGNVVSSTG